MWPGAASSLRRPLSLPPLPQTRHVNSNEIFKMKFGGSAERSEFRKIRANRHLRVQRGAETGHSSVCCWSPVRPAARGREWVPVAALRFSSPATWGTWG